MLAWVAALVRTYSSSAWLCSQAHIGEILSEQLLDGGRLQHIDAHAGDVGHLLSPAVIQEALPASGEAVKQQVYWLPGCMRKLSRYGGEGTGVVALQGGDSFPLDQYKIWHGSTKLTSRPRCRADAALGDLLPPGRAGSGQLCRLTPQETASCAGQD